MNVTVCKRYGFLSVLAAIIRKIATNDLGLRMVMALLFIHQPDRVARKADDADWRYQTHVKKYDIFLMCVIMAFLRAGNPCIAP